jgi:hypothetical protein
MGDLNALGSEKLQGMDKIRRIMEIARYNETPKQEINELSTTNYTITLADGITYGIVKERLGYIIKSGLNESTLEYNDPIKHRKHFRSYSEAMKKLNLMAGELNRVNGNDYEIPLIGEQADSKKKFVLKQNKPKTDAPPADDMGSTPPPPPPPPAGDMGSTPPPAPPAGDMGMETPPSDDMGATPPPAGDMGATPPADDMGMTPPPADDMGMETPPADDMGMESPDMDAEDDGEEPQGPSGLKSIQKLTGRLSQKIRSFDKDKGMDSQDIKYVVNSILSAIDLENLDEDDKDDILAKFDESDEYDMGDEELDMGTEEDLDMEEPGMEEPGMGMSEPMTQEPKEGYTQIMDSLFTESKVEKVLSKYFTISPEEKPILEQKRKKDFLKEKLNSIKVKKEIEQLSESLKQLEVANELLSENKNVKFLGKTNLENLVFSVNGKQVKVTPRGRVI